MRQLDRQRLIETSPSEAPESAPLGTEASVYYLPGSRGCVGVRGSSRLQAAVGDHQTPVRRDLAAHSEAVLAGGLWPRGDEAATTVWIGLMVRRVFLELELANLQLERSRLILENQLYRSLLRREPAATQRG